MHVLVYGATGTTGTLIAESLRERGVPMVLSGRDPSRLDALAARLGGVETRPAQVHDLASLRAAMAGARVVISCAGPFSRVGEPVVAAAIDSGVHYLDTSGEQAFMRDIYERYEARARKARVAVVSGMAFRIALGDLGAHLAAQALLRGDADSGSMAGELLDMADYPADEIIVAYAFERLRTSAGTRLSALTDLTLPGYLWVGDRWVPVPPAAEHRRVSFGGEQGECDTLSFPSGEVITVPRHAPARRVQTYVSLAESGPIAGLVGRVAPAVGPLVGALLRSPLGAYAYSRAGADQAAPSDTDRAFTRFAVLAEARRGFARQRVLIRGADPYGLTAAIAGYAAERILAMDEVSTGVRAPAEVFDPAAALAGIAERWPLVVSKSF